MPASPAPPMGETRPVPPPAPGLSAADISAREKIVAGREKLRRQHESGSPGVQLCAHFTDLLEAIVLELFDEALAGLSPAERSDVESDTAIIAHAGFGRRAMAPYSDIDVMLLHARGMREKLSPVIRRFSQNLYDTGIDVGFAARTPADACDLALADATILTSLSESRLLLR